MKKWQHCEVSFLVKDILIEALGMWLFLDELYITLRNIY